MPALGARALCVCRRRATDASAANEFHFHVSVPTAELTVPSATRRTAVPPGPGSTDRLAGGRLYLVMAAGALLIAALSLLIPSTPSYDPWAWLVWGREIVAPQPADDRRPDLEAAAGDLHDDLRAVRQGRSPTCGWWSARAGAVMAVGMVFKVSVRLTRQLAVRPGDDAPRSLFERVIPPMLAGLIAAFGLTFAGGFITANALGYSEGLMTAIVLIAVERHLDGALPAGVRGRLLGGARPPRDLAVLGSLRAVAVVEGPGRAQARDRAVRADPGAVVPARVLGLGSLLPRRQPRASRRAPTAPRSPSARSAPSSPTTPGRRSRSGPRRSRSSPGSRRRSGCGGRAGAGGRHPLASKRAQALAGIAIAAGARDSSGGS